MNTGSCTCCIWRCTRYIQAETETSIPQVTGRLVSRQGYWSAVVQILDRLTRDYAYSPQANCRKGGLLALAAAAVALAERKQVNTFTQLGAWTSSCWRPFT